jgi:copper/silver efflux system protein
MQVLDELVNGTVVREMDAKLQFPGLSNTWTMPVENRLDMELTGIKTPLGLKIQGPTLEGIQQTGAQIQQLLSSLPEVRSIFAERVSQGFYINVEVNRLSLSLRSDRRRCPTGSQFGDRW